MSKYTTEVRFICETAAALDESQGFNSINDVLEKAVDKVFNFDFPIFDENYRVPLEIKILRHFYTREICEETVGLWKLRLEDKLNMIMPFYNKLYESELLKFNPFYDVNLTRSHSGNRDTTENAISENVNSSNGVIERDRNTSGETSNERANTSTGVMNENVDRNDKNSSVGSDLKWDKYSDTPQGGVSKMNVDDNMYLTNARKVTDENTNAGTSEGRTETEQTRGENSSGKEDGSYSDSTNESIKDGRNSVEKGERSNRITGTDAYVENVFGKQGGGSYSKLLVEFRKTFLNIDQMVIDELGDLFFGLW